MLDIGLWAVFWIIVAAIPLSLCRYFFGRYVRNKRDNPMQK